MKADEILEFIRFDERKKKQIYNDQKEVKDIFDLQVEGVTKVINTLNQYKIALLADEVGMGKTFQALAVVANQFKIKPDSKVLIITPRKEVLKQWREQEYKTFYEKHLIEKINLPDDKENNIGILHNFKNGLFENKNNKIVFAKTTSFMAKENFDNESRKRKLKCSIKNFNLIIIDEAHKFRNYKDEANIGSNNNSNMINTAKMLFPFMNEQCKVLLLTATPLHSREGDLKRVVDLFGISLGKTDKEIMDKIMIRRLRIMSNGETKYHYRNEIAKAIQLSKQDNYQNELFFAMLQKEYVKTSTKNLSTSRNLLSYLEGTRFDDLGENESEEINNVLNKFCNSYKNTLPTNNKYDETISQLVKNDAKSLVFVRRVPSAYEIARKYIEVFDKKAWKLIDDALDSQKNIKMPKDRDHFNRIMETYDLIIKYDEIKFDWDSIEGIIEEFRENKNNIPEGMKYIKKKTAKYMIIDSYFEVYHKFEAEKFLSFLKELNQVEPLKDEYISTPKSVILDFFKKKKDLRSTHASRFLQKFSSSDSPYGKFFEEDFANILQNNNFSTEKRTLIKSAVLHASIGVVELYCCDLRAKGNYNAFLQEVQNQSKKKSLTFIKQVNDFLEHYEKFEKYIKFNENSKDSKENEDVKELSIDYTLFHNAQPAYPYVGQTKNESVIARFNSPFFPTVLCGTSTLQEGVNLHLFCDQVIHFGAAYTMGDDEQRIGRIDRLMGKIDRNLLNNNQDATLEIIYPFLEKTFDEDSLRRLLYNKRNTELLIDKGSEIIREDYSIEVDNTISELLHKPYKKIVKVFFNEP